MPRAATVLLLAAIGALAAQAIWRAIDSGRPPPVTVESRTGWYAPAGAHDGSPLSPLTDLPVFGTLALAAPQTPVLAPETALRLRLLGLVAYDSPGQGRAIIAEEGGPERVYAVGDPVSGGQARLHRIHADRVILERDRSFETLRLPLADTTALVAAPSENWRSAFETGLDPGYETGFAGEESEGKPQRPTRDPGLMVLETRRVVRDGGLRGLQVRNTENGRSFRQMGIEPGDVIMAINGFPASRVRLNQAGVEHLLSSGLLEFVLERDGEMRQVSIDPVALRGGD